MKIREAKIKDAAKLVYLIDQLGYKISLENIKKNIRQYTKLNNHKIWVAIIENKVIGCIAGAITCNFHKRGSFFRVITLVIDKDYRKKGAGLELMKTAQDYAKKKKCCHIELTSGSNRAKLGSHDFYKKLGYTDLHGIKKYFAKKI